MCYAVLMKTTPHHTTPHHTTLHHAQPPKTAVYAQIPCGALCNGNKIRGRDKDVTDYGHLGDQARGCVSPLWGRAFCAADIPQGCDTQHLVCTHTHARTTRRHTLTYTHTHTRTHIHIYTRRRFLPKTATPSSCVTTTRACQRVLPPPPQSLITLITPVSHNLPHL